MNILSQQFVVDGQMIMEFLGVDYRMDEIKESTSTQPIRSNLSNTIFRILMDAFKKMVR